MIRDLAVQAQAAFFAFTTRLTGGRLTLRYIAEGEFHPTELDWLAIQRLKQAGLVEDRRAGPSITAEGRRALQRLLAGV